MATTKNTKSAKANKSANAGASKAAKPSAAPAKKPAKSAAQKKASKSAPKASPKKPASKQAKESSKPQVLERAGQKSKVELKPQKSSASSANSGKAGSRANAKPAKVAGKTPSMKNPKSNLKEKKDTKKARPKASETEEIKAPSKAEPARGGGAAGAPKARARADKKSIAEVIAELIRRPHQKPKARDGDREKSREPERLSAGGRPSAGIYFSMRDVENFLSGKKSAGQDEKSPSGQGASDKKKSAKKSGGAVVVPVPKRALPPASIVDILGFNPIEQSRSLFEEKDIPQKWRKYYKLLTEIKDRVLNGTSNKVDMVSSDNGELSHENSNQGMDAADIGSKNFERDMAMNLMSAEQNIVSEVNAAIERMRKGTYGVCEVTGKLIPESRLLAIPFARCTIEGQRQRELELKRLKSGAKREQFGVDMQEDFSSGELPEEEE